MGDILSVSYDADGGWLKVHLKGSPNPDLQEVAHDMWKQGQQPALWIHRCSNQCNNHQGLAPNEAHGLTVRTPGADLPWNGNLLQQDPLGFRDLEEQLLPKATGQAQPQGGIRNLLGEEEAYCSRANCVLSLASNNALRKIRNAVCSLFEAKSYFDALSFTCPTLACRMSCMSPWSANAKW